MASIRLRNHDIVVEASPVGDRSPQEAVKLARRLFADGIEFDKALVDRFGGLVLIGARGTWHFQTPICGDEGEGSRATTWILGLFRFGTVEEIWVQVNHGDSTAKAIIYR